MDILDILDDYLNSKKLIPIEEAIEELKNGKQLDEVAEKFGVNSSILIEILKQNKINYLEISNSINNNEAYMVPYKLISDTENNILDFLPDIIYKLYTGENLYSLASKYGVETNEFKAFLKNQGYKRRWVYTGYGLEIPIEIKQILYELNINNKNLEEVSIKRGMSTDIIKEKLLENSCKKIWTYETLREDDNVISEIEEFKIFTDATTAILKLIEYKGKQLVPSVIVNDLLQINTSYYHNLRKNRFRNMEHYIVFDAETIKTISNYIPTLRSLKGIKLYTIEGIELLLVLSNKENPENFNKISSYIGKINKNYHYNNQEMINIEAIDFVEELNNGLDIDELALKTNITADKLCNILEYEGYYYNSLFEIWTSKTEDELVELAIKDLNRGTTLYDLSARYMKNRKDRLDFVVQLENRIENLNYRYVQSEKKWIKSDSNVERKLNLEYVISYLNETQSFKKVEERFDIKSTSLRVILKQNGYQYDTLLKVWSSKSREELLKEIFKHINNNEYTIEEFVLKRDINKVQLIEEFRKYNIQITQHVNNIELGKGLELKVPTISNSLSEDELTIIREIITEWTEIQDRQKKDEHKAEIKIKLSTSILLDVLKLSETIGKDESETIEYALKKFFSIKKDTRD